MKVLKIMFVAAAVSFLACAAFADYKTDIVNGNKAYKAKKWDDAAAWYRKAYDEKPSDRLKVLIAAIEKKIGTESAGNKQPVELEKPEKPLDLGPVLLVALDLALAGGAGYMIFYESHAQEEYNKLYAEINNTTHENYLRLVAKQKETYMIRTLEAVAISAAAAAIIYTAGDAFFMHGVFKQDVSLKSGIAPGFAYAGIERDF